MYFFHRKETQVSPKIVFRGAVTRRREQRWRKAVSPGSGVESRARHRLCHGGKPRPSYSLPAPGRFYEGEDGTLQ